MEIKICQVCEGAGAIKVQDPRSDVDSVICLKCEGKGRVYHKVYELELPLNRKQKFYDMDEQIFKIIRRIEN